MHPPRSRTGRLPYPVNVANSVSFGTYRLQFPQEQLTQIVPRGSTAICRIDVCDDRSRIFAARQSEPHALAYSKMASTRSGEVIDNRVDGHARTA